MLIRIKTEKEEELRREEEREEIERRRAMPEEQRMKEDLERAQKLREDKPKGQQKFLQKYWHKGAFHQACYYPKRLRVADALIHFIRTKRFSNAMILRKQLNLQ